MEDPRLFVHYTLPKLLSFIGDPRRLLGRGRLLEFYGNRENCTL